MGTNYYRIPLENEMKKIKKEIIDNISTKSDFYIVSNVSLDMYYKHDENLYDDLIKSDFLDICVHIGKNSFGWKFLWDFNNNKYYKNKSELIDFCKSGRIFDEYGIEHEVNEFLEFALNKNNGYDGYTARNESIIDNPSGFNDKCNEVYIDGLRVSEYTNFF